MHNNQQACHIGEIYYLIVHTTLNTFLHKIMIRYVAKVVCFHFKTHCPTTYFMLCVYSILYVNILAAWTTSSPGLCPLVLARLFGMPCFPIIPNPSCQPSTVFVTHSECNLFTDFSLRNVLH